MRGLHRAATLARDAAAGLERAQEGSLLSGSGRHSQLCGASLSGRQCTSCARAFGAMLPRLTATRRRRRRGVARPRAAP
eukprot:6974862-Pyramimonas_sp.AAC.1